MPEKEKNENKELEEKKSFISRVIDKLDKKMGKKAEEKPPCCGGGSKDGDSSCC